MTAGSNPHPPVTTKSPDGWTLTVSAHDETEMPVPSLTNEAATREYNVGGVFNGSAPTTLIPDTCPVSVQLAARRLSADTCADRRHWLSRDVDKGKTAGPRRS
jgi:hypothetical protein